MKIKRVLLGAMIASFSLLFHDSAMAETVVGYDGTINPFASWDSIEKEATEDAYTKAEKACTPGTPRYTGKPIVVCKTEVPPIPPFIPYYHCLVWLSFECVEAR